MSAQCLRLRKTVCSFTPNTVPTTPLPCRSPDTLQLPPTSQVLSTSSALQTWAEARNPSGELSTALQSYLIRPVQRILKYPLLLREIRSPVFDM